MIYTFITIVIILDLYISKKIINDKTYEAMIIGAELTGLYTTYTNIMLENFFL